MTADTAATLAALRAYRLTQDWRRAPGASGRWISADGRARVTQDTYQPAATAELGDGTTRRSYSVAEAIGWADWYLALNGDADGIPARWTQ